MPASDDLRALNVRLAEAISGKVAARIAFRECEAGRDVAPVVMIAGASRLIEGAVALVIPYASPVLTPDEIIDFLADPWSEAIDRTLHVVETRREGTGE
jgi:hypothetical protein